MIRQQQATVRFNHQLAPDCHHLGLACKDDFGNAVPGQFVMVRTVAQNVPLLRRPFSICGLMGEKKHFEGIELLIKVVGQGTRLLAGLSAGDTVSLLGPLGRGFRRNEHHQKIYLAAGGIGIAPIRFLAADLIAGGVDPCNIHLFQGGRSRNDLICREAFEYMDIAVTVTTDDGSDGDQCLITDPLEAAIKAHKPDMVYACGPHGMLACVAGIARRCQVPCQISIETMMACGMGVCLGCAVESRQQEDRYLHACVHGPVFDVEEIKIGLA